MNLRSVNLNLLPIFDALMQHRHLSKAALSMAMSQPAVSNALKRLRLTFHDELFVRTAKGLMPTARAKQIHLDLQPALQSIQHSVEGTMFDPATSEQVINMSLNGATEYLISSLLAQFFRQVAPNMQLNLHPEYLESIPEQLKSGALDYAIDYLPYEQQQFGEALLAVESLSFICAKHHPVIEQSVTMEQYEALPQVTLVPRKLRYPHQHNYGTPIEQLMGANTLKRNIAMHVSSFVVIPQIVAQSDLIAVVPSRLVLNSPLAEQLQILAVPFTYPQVEMRLIWHKSRERQAAHQWLVEQLPRLISMTTGTI